MTGLYRIRYALRRLSVPVARGEYHPELPGQEKAPARRDDIHTAMDGARARGNIRFKPAEEGMLRGVP